MTKNRPHAKRTPGLDRRTMGKLIAPKIVLPEGTVTRYFHYFKRTDQFEKINEQQLRKKVRVQTGRDDQPSLAIIDSQSVKSTRTSGERGYTINSQETNHC